MRHIKYGITYHSLWNSWYPHTELQAYQHISGQECYHLFVLALLVCSLNPLRLMDSWIYGLYNSKFTQPVTNPTKMTILIKGMSKTWKLWKHTHTHTHIHWYTYPYILKASGTRNIQNTLSGSPGYLSDCIPSMHKVRFGLVKVLKSI